ncbi:CDP-glycerol glycerophosphotransferase family protein [Candidatus Enterococcus clewellii]|uniref:Teichoic acid glycerol-phosphate primase n=1 Tax=Candidatus Enterococcus clewellii TaxID=1834193 RepID=A0A242JWY0_9ENTE|nr:CDP-glycerol glycerophosphotransferase family protein [Enterococcus sp. 9E7_DIV0242]OTP09827.1 hypothetical protein A5888_004023 [Enterococcus sp. 9E7_DIV0242]
MIYLKSFYLWALCGLPKPQKRIPIVYIMSFTANDGGLIRRLAEIYQNDFAVFYTPRSKAYAEELAHLGVQILPYTPWQLLFRNRIGLLKNAQVILVDNYFSELSLLKNGQAVIQLWHAIGAIKKFGWEDPQTQLRGQADRRRFQRVYDQFTDIVVASEAMGKVFQRSYRVSPEVIRYLGVPKTDELLAQAIESKDSKAAYILYAPTYRKTPVQMEAVLKQALTVFAQFPEKQFLLKLHPAATDQSLPLPENVRLTTVPLEQLFPQVTLLITDYSASVFEFLLYKEIPYVLFFVPDKAQYEQQPGIQDGVWDTVPGGVAPTAEALQEMLKEETYKNDAKQARVFHDSWHTYNDGESINRVLALVEARKKG